MIKSHIEIRNKFSEIKDHALWTATECKQNKTVTEEIMECETEGELRKVISRIRFI